MHRIVHLFYFSLFKAMLICYNKKQRKESKQHLAHDEENIADAGLFHHTAHVRHGRYDGYHTEGQGTSGTEPETEQNQNPQKIRFFTGETIVSPVFLLSLFHAFVNRSACTRNLFHFVQNVKNIVNILFHSRILAWRIPWTEEAGGLQSMGSQQYICTAACSLVLT